MKKILLVLSILPILVFAADDKFTGSSKGFNGTVKVEVTIINGKMKEIKIVEAKEGAYAFYAFDQLIPQMIKQNNTKVDIVSGATISSKALINAVNQALATSKK